jgi:hypothetical protein
MDLHGINALNGQVLALLLMHETEAGEDDWAVVGGVVRFRDGHAFLDLGPENADIELVPQWLARIKPTDDETRDVWLNASYYLPLGVADIPHDTSLHGIRMTGLKWPKA